MATTKTDKSEVLQTIEARFTRAWISCKNPDLDGENPHFKNKYATLKETLRVIREACKAERLAYIQKFSFVKDDMTNARLTSFVTDESGEKLLLSEFPVQYIPNSQQFGAALTYTKRQQAQTDWGITGEPDDDAESISKAAPQPKTQAKASIKTNKREKLLNRIADLQKQLANPELLNEMVHSMFGVGLVDLNEDQLFEIGKQLALMVKGQNREH